MGGYDDLLGILRAAREELIANEATPPVACPIHGEPLQTVANSTELHCVVGHFVNTDGTIG